MPRITGTESARLAAEMPPREKIKDPELRLRNDAAAVNVNDGTTAETVIDQLRSAPSGVVLRGPDGVPEAVVLSPERYADLASTAIRADGSFIAGRNGITPHSHDLERLMVEQVNMTERWQPGAH